VLTAALALVVSRYYIYIYIYIYMLFSSNKEIRVMMMLMIVMAPGDVGSAVDATATQLKRAQPIARMSGGSVGTLGVGAAGAGEEPASAADAARDGEERAAQNKPG
jgi:hypothetical protein